VVFEKGRNKKCPPKMRKKVDAKRGFHSRWKIDLHGDFEHVNLNIQPK
jgi:hypothetical protein